MKNLLYLKNDMLKWEQLHTVQKQLEVFLNIIIEMHQEIQ